MQKHYYYFGKELQNKMKGNALNQDNWNMLRIDEKEGPFSIENTIELYEKNCDNHSSYRNIADIIITELVYNGSINKIVSLGSGKGILEYHIKKICPDIIVVCTDYAEEGIKKLKNVFVEMDDGFQFDILNDNYEMFEKNSVILMNRLSTEFSFEQWVSIFKKMYLSGIDNIIFIPTGLDTFFDMLIEKARHIKNKILRRNDVFCGWLYSKKEFYKMFNKYFKVYKIVPIDNSAIFFLKRD